MKISMNFPQEEINRNAVWCQKIIYTGGKDGSFFWRYIRHQYVEASNPCALVLKGH